MSFSDGPGSVPGLGYARTARLARNWWAVMLRGVFAILFGIAALLVPGAALGALVLVFGIYAIVDGVGAILSAVWAAAHHERWGLLLLEGAAGIIAGLAALAWPALTVLVFAWLLAAWAIVTGAFMLSAAFSLHHGGWLLGVGGAISLVWGILLAIAPVYGVFGLILWLGVYGIVFGIAMVALGFRLRGVAGQLRHGP